MSNKKLIVVTGANGFIGNALIKELCLRGYNVRATVRSDSALNVMEQFRINAKIKNLSNQLIGDLSNNLDWTQVLKDADTVIHCAAYAHILKMTGKTTSKLFSHINYNGTHDLAKQASKIGIRRFIFMSSIGVLGGSSHSTPFTEESSPAPEYEYARSKWEAEQSLAQLTEAMETVIIRPPLVYGPDVKGNFERLLSLISKNIPLPLGGINNKRQFIGIDNLVDFTLKCIESPKAANQTFVIADDETVSTTQLIKNISLLMGYTPRLLPLPCKLTNWCLNIIGKSRLSDQLLSNLQVDTKKSRSTIGWEPPHSMSDQLMRTVTWYLDNKVES